MLEGNLRIGITIVRSSRVDQRWGSSTGDAQVLGYIGKDGWRGICNLNQLGMVNRVAAGVGSGPLALKGIIAGAASRQSSLGISNRNNCLAIVGGT